MVPSPVCFKLRCKAGNGDEGGGRRSGRKCEAGCPGRERPLDGGSDAIAWWGEIGTCAKGQPLGSKAACKGATDALSCRLARCATQSPVYILSRLAEQSCENVKHRSVDTTCSFFGSSFKDWRESFGRTDCRMLGHRCTETQNSPHSRLLQTFVTNKLSEFLSSPLRFQTQTFLNTAGDVNQECDAPSVVWRRGLQVSLL